MSYYSELHARLSEITLSSTDIVNFISAWEDAIRAEYSETIGRGYVPAGSVYQRLEAFEREDEDHMTTAQKRQIVRILIDAGHSLESYVFGEMWVMLSE